MERLTGLDAGFLYMETPTQLLHTIKVATIDPAGSAVGYSFEQVREVLASHLHLLPAFRRRVLMTPGRVHHPVWIEDPDFDLARHLHLVRAPEPGNREALDSVVSEVAGQPLDRRRPLWGIWVVEGLEGGQVGFIAKVHHCVADGVKAAEMLMAVLGPDPAAGAPGDTGGRWQGEVIPSRRELLAAAWRDLRADLRRFPHLLARTWKGARAVAARRRAGRASPPVPFSTVSAPFNRSLVSSRIFVSETLDLDLVKQVRRKLDCTVNDVILGVCAGALRQWLADRGGIPDRPLIAGVPVSTRDEFRVGRSNSVSNLFTSLPVHLADPVERVREASRMMAAAKEQHAALGPDLLEQWSQLTPPALFGGIVGAYSRLNLADRHRPPINLIVSNVPGPPEALYVVGARLTGIWSMGPILENIGLNITVWSYVNQLNFGIVACPDAMPDLRRLAETLGSSLDELVKAAA